MSYDHYIAIWKLLRYMTIMNHRVCTLLVLASWLASFLIIFPSLMLFIQLDYCKSNVINHFTCDYFPLLYLSCSDTKFLEILGFSCAVFILLFTLALIILSYTYVIRTILRIPSTTQRTKAFPRVRPTWLSSPSLTAAAFSCIWIHQQRTGCLWARELLC